MFGSPAKNRGVYHSDYDDFYWYSHFSDTTFVYGRTLAQVDATALHAAGGRPRPALRIRTVPLDRRPLSG